MLAVAEMYIKSSIRRASVGATWQRRRSSGKQRPTLFCLKNLRGFRSIREPLSGTSNMPEAAGFGSKR